MTSTFGHCQGMARVGKRTYRSCEKLGDHQVIGGKRFCEACAKRERARLDLTRRQPLQAVVDVTKATPECPVQGTLF